MSTKRRRLSRWAWVFCMAWGCGGGGGSGESLNESPGDWNLRVESMTPFDALLSWDSLGMVEYTVEIRVDDGPYRTLATTRDVIYHATDLRPNTEYGFRVIAGENVSNEVPASTPQAVLAVGTPEDGDTPIVYVGDPSVSAESNGHQTAFVQDTKQVLQLGSTTFHLMTDGGVYEEGSNTPIPDLPPLKSLAGDKEKLFGVAFDGHVWTWPTASPNEALRIPGPADAVEIAVGEKGFITRTDDGCITLWLDATGTAIPTQVAGVGTAKELVALGSEFFVRTESGIYSISEEGKAAKIPEFGESTYTKIGVSGDGLLAQNDAGSLLMYQPTTQEVHVVATDIKTFAAGTDYVVTISKEPSLASSSQLSVIPLK